MAENLGFQLVEGGAPPCLQAPLFLSCGVVEHGFSTRLGGCSTGPLASLNMAFHTGDQPRRVLENRRRFFNRWGYSIHQLVAAQQVHGTGLVQVGRDDLGRGSTPGSSIPGCDALVTTEPGLVLTAFAADCQLIFLVEPQVPVIALAHAGWRGTLGEIGPRAVEYLAKECGARRERILALLSPAICGRCYRVGEEVARQFAGAGWGEPPYFTPAGEGGCLHLTAINREQLIRAGIRAEHIGDNSWCTSCRPDLFYSYRREGGHTGRMAGFLVLNNSRRRSL
ncbi:MAG TPA: peptidoglycan editing factor PgeF [Bacillota bacterium]|nr:peptidoglycan editing factor PgeF [Bacillota bacterium]HOB87699.1 peptidoglycan editing factor PgeF [Bacillota bacterium]HOP69141.1 peptidoglycan editing factor PgeF [Bacillota bacterium]HPT33803.1 peptidoglycan editing factor PgeF [Bacillota bacterium]HPZ65311.1 peptidoglycan editing factor PgeF [Bacillota bacterium]